MKQPDLVWGAWLVTVVGSFAVLEARALKNPEHGHTLSATTRRCLGVHPARPWRWVGTYALVSGLAWFGQHMLIDEDLRKRKPRVS